MESHPIFLLTFLTLAVVAAHAALPAEIYWKSMLPTTPMPKAIMHLLHSDSVGGKGAAATMAKLRPSNDNNRNYGLAATESALHDADASKYFFLQKDLLPGTEKDLHFIKSRNAATFLPRQVAETIPFSSNKVPEILNKFSVKYNTMDAEIIKATIKECEEPGIRGEEKYCATSLESMIDFSTSKLGKNVQALSTEVDKQTQFQKYTITKGVKMATRNKAVVCHKQNYPYAVFYCHKTDTTAVYSVPLEGEDKSRLIALAVCHTDTSDWNPKHLAFQLLNVKPGTVPICHFLSEDNLVWVPK